MNARQKAKQLKKIAEQYKAEAESWRQYEATEEAKRHELEARIKTIHFFRLVTQKELECVPDDLIKRGLATEIGLALIDANLVRWKTEDVQEMCGMRYEAIIEALTQEDRE